jgi:DNA-binding transcriptional ArsR family regulator
MVLCSCARPEEVTAMWPSTAREAGGGLEAEGLAARVRFFKGFTNPGRLRIIEALRQGERSVGELVQETGLPQAQVSNALTCLKWCGFVRARQEGRRIYYAIANPAVYRILELADMMVAAQAAQLYSCVVLNAEEALDGAAGVETEVSLEEERR